MLTQLLVVAVVVVALKFGIMIKMPMENARQGHQGRRLGRRPL